MKPIAMLATVCAGLCLAACGGQGGNTKTYTYPNEGMEPTISYHEEITADLDAYDDAVPARGDIIVFHPPRGSDLGGECGVKHPPSEACREPIPGPSSQTYIKRIIGIPGNKLSIRKGLPIVNGREAFTQAVRECSKASVVAGPLRGGGETLNVCELPKPVTIPPGHYFVMGDNSGLSEDSRVWGPIPRASILGKVELG